MESVYDHLISLNDELKGFHTRMSRLSKVDVKVGQLNNSVGSLLGALHVRRSCTALVSNLNEEESSLEKQQLHYNNDSQKEENMMDDSSLLSIKKEEKSIHPPVVIQVVPMIKKWKWKKGIKARIPKVYRNAVAMERLEKTLLFFQDTSPDGVLLSQVVSLTGLSVLKCKEMVQMLVTLNQLCKTRGKEGFVYHLQLVKLK